MVYHPRKCVGARVQRIADWHARWHKPDLPMRGGTIISTDRDAAYNLRSLVQWDDGSEQLCDNRDLRLIAPAPTPSKEDE